MKSKLLMFGLSAAALVSPAMAATKTFNLTGATAFRKAAILTIQSLYNAGYGAKYDVTGTTSAKYVTFVGTMALFPGDTIVVRCSFTGSVEGLRAITSANILDQPEYIVASAVTAGVVSGGGVPTVTTAADYSFSDVSISSSPYGATPVYPSPDSSAGVVVFSMVTNDGSPITNVTSQNFRALFARGYQQAKLFTGVASDTSYVVASGRNDGSGTRTTYLAETGAGITNVVKQYVATGSSGDQNTQWELAPAGGAFQSTVWGQDQTGNGGYASGGDLRAVLARKGTAATIVVNIPGPGLVPIVPGVNKVDTISFLGLSDAIQARDIGGINASGAKLIAYNGVALSGIANDLTAPFELTTADIAKITEGTYTAWGNQQFYGRNGISADKIALFDEILANIDTNLGDAGIPNSLMNVQRSEDGGVVGP